MENNTIHQKGKMHVALDDIISYIAAIGIPALLYILSLCFSGYSGAAAFASAMKVIGLGKQNRGPIVLLLLSLLSKMAAKFSVKMIASLVLQQLYRDGESEESLIQKIDRYPMSEATKIELKKFIVGFENKSVCVMS